MVDETAETEESKKGRKWMRALAPALSGVVAGILAGTAAAHASGVRDEQERVQERRIQALENKAEKAFEAVIRADERWGEVQRYMRTNDERWIRVFGEK